MEEGGKYSVLLVGLLNDRHIQRLISHLRECNPKARIDFLASSCGDKVPNEVADCLSNLYVPKYDKDTVSGITKIKATLGLLKTLKNNHYDVVNIHYPCYYHLFYYKYLRKMTSNLLLTPWGSDVYRTKVYERVLLRILYKKADYVSGGENKFSDDVKRIYNLPQEKIVCLDIGSDTIDYISDKLELINKEQAKEKIGVEGKYVITCSYNGSPAHRHEIIINSINKIKEKLPANTVLFFPFTYAGTEAYAKQLKEMLVGMGLDFIFFEKYLSVEQLYLIRRASDMFIHIQPTDANSQCLQEYMLCGCKVVNGEWLRYKELEIGGGLPYYLVKDLNSLPESILFAYSSPNIIIDPSVINYIKGYGWKEWIKKWDAFYLSCSKN